MFGTPRRGARAAALAWLVVVASSGRAAADDGASWTFSESSTGVAWETPPPPSRSARHTDAHADRVLLSPTAETHPEGTLFITAYEVIIPSVGYAFTDQLHASVTGFTTFDAGFAELNLKANLLRSRHLRIAATTAIDYLAGNTDEDDEEFSQLLFGRVGATLQICFELRCRTSLSLSAMVVAHDNADTILPVGAAAGFTARLSGEATLLIEYSSLFNASRSLPFLDLPVFLIAYGVRLSASEAWALDLSLVRAMESDEGIRADRPGLIDLLGVPFIAFTYRFAL